MAKDTKPREARYITAAFEGDAPPPLLGAAVISLVELCQIAMPSPTKIRELFTSSGLQRGDEESGLKIAETLAYDKGLMEDPIKNFRHETYSGERKGVPVVFMLSEGKAKNESIVMCSALFIGAAEADAVKAAAHVTKSAPFTGSTVKNAAGVTVRRVLWQMPKTGGVRFFVVAGPPDMDALDRMRAFIAIGKAK